MCSTATLNVLTSVVHLTLLDVQSVPAVSHRPVVDTRVGALEVTLETSNQRLSTLGPQVELKDAEIAAKVAQFVSQRGASVKMTEKDHH